MVWFSLCTKYNKMDVNDPTKKAKLARDAMDVDTTGGTATLVSLKTSNTTEGITDKEILKRLRPVVLPLEPFADTASICIVLKDLEFLQLSSLIHLAQKSSIRASLLEIYKAARIREAEKVRTVGDVDISDRVAAIEIRSAVLHSRPVQIEATNVKIYQDHVPDLQNPGSLTRIIVRSEDEAFWNHCIESSLKGHKVGGVGNPGIGKTTTTLYLLQKLIMDNKEPVVYTILKRSGSLDVFYEFVPVFENEEVKDINVTVYHINNAEKRSKIPSLKKQGAFYVVDPGDYEGSCDDSSELLGVRFIMAASLDSKHWGGNNFTKFRGPSNREKDIESLDVIGPPRKQGVFVYGSLWTGCQLLVAKPYTALKPLHDDEILRRLRIVGGSFRDIAMLDEEKFKVTVATALNLDVSTVQELAEGRHQFVFDETAPSSVLVGVGPHDQDMERFKITLKSDYVEELLAEKYLRTTWYQVLDEDNAGNWGNLFESYLRRKFSMGQVKLTEDQVRESKNKKPPNKTEKNYLPVVGGMMLGAKRTIVRVSNMNEYVQTDQAKQYMVYSRNESEPLIDMIFRVENGYDAIQATISKKHGAAADKIRTLKRELNLKAGEKLRIFFAVPSSRYRDFVTDPVNPLLDQADL
ncbi:MAG: hypothetical protein AAGJ35_05630, partial [Myxococcota bacterium]